MLYNIITYNTLQCVNDKSTLIQKKKKWIDTRKEIKYLY